MQKEKEFFSIIGNNFFFAFLLQFSFVTFFPIVSDLKVCFIDIDIIFFFFFHFHHEYLFVVVVVVVSAVVRVEIDSSKTIKPRILSIRTSGC